MSTLTEHTTSPIGDADYDDGAAAVEVEPVELVGLLAEYRDVT